MYCVISTTYNVTENGLVLRQNWVDNFEDQSNMSADVQLSDYLTKYGIPLDFPYPSKNSVSDIMSGVSELENVIIHVRIVRF